MANYKEAIAKVLKHEGGYVNDPDDKGGETYKGISRKNWSKWIGWNIVDNSKSLANFPKCLYSNTLLNEYVVDFYKRNFWVPIGGDNIKDQDVANILVDAAVLEGIKPAVKRAQRIVGISQSGEFSEELKIKLNSLV